MNDMKTRLIGHILNAHKRVFATKELFIRHVQFEPDLSILSRVEIEGQINSLEESGIISIISDPEPFILEVTLQSAHQEKKTSSLFITDNVLSPRTINELREVFRDIQAGDQIYFSTYGGTTFLDEFTKEFENSLLQPDTCLHVMMLGSLSDPILKETDPAKFEKAIANAHQAWFSLQHMAGKGKVKIRQCHGLAGINRCLIVVDASKRIKYCGYMVWRLGLRGVDGAYLSSFLPDLNISQLILYDFLTKWETATTRNGRIFLCHSSKDKLFTRKLFEKLENDGIPTWFDERDILAGEDFIQQMEQGIRQSDYVGVVLSSNFLQGLWAQREYRAALEKEVTLNRVHVIPLYKETIENVEYPSFLKTKSYADFRQDFDEGYKRLVRSLQALPLRHQFIK